MNDRDSQFTGLILLEIVTVELGGEGSAPPTCSRDPL